MLIAIQADSHEHQRSQLTAHFSTKNITLEMYRFDGVIGALIELFCMTKSALDNPNLRAGSTGRSFCIIEDGLFDDIHSGYWAEDEETGEVGFLPEFEDVFWVHDDDSFAWVSHHFEGRKMRRGAAKGKGKGRGFRGRGRFKARRKGKGKGFGKGKPRY